MDPWKSRDLRESGEKLSRNPPGISRHHRSEPSVCYALLQEVVAKLERGNLSLEATTVLYGEGLGLAERCKELLEVTERTIRRIQQNEDIPDAEGEN